MIDDTLSILRNYTVQVWKGRVTWSKETLRTTLGKWYPTGDTRSLECDVYGCPTVDWGFARRWHKTAPITVLNQSQGPIKDIPELLDINMKEMYEDTKRKWAILKPIGSSEGVTVLKELTSATRNREGYVKFQSESDKCGYMQVVYYEAMQVFMAWWPKEQDQLCDSIDKIQKSIQATKKIQETVITFLCVYC